MKSAVSKSATSTGDAAKVNNATLSKKHRDYLSLENNNEKDRIQKTKSKIAKHLQKRMTCF